MGGAHGIQAKETNDILTRLIMHAHSDLGPFAIVPVAQAQDQINSGSNSNNSSGAANVNGGAEEIIYNAPPIPEHFPHPRKKTSNRMDVVERRVGDSQSWNPVKSDRTQYWWTEEFILKYQVSIITISHQDVLVYHATLHCLRHCVRKTLH